MEKALSRRLILVSSIMVLFVMYASVAESQEENTTGKPCYRCGGLELSLPIIYSTSSKIEGKHDTKVELNDDWGFGLGLGYNINEHFLVGGLFTWSNRGYEATYQKDDNTSGKYNGNMDSATLALNGTYNILKGNITPFVTAGVGMTWIDTNIPNGTGQDFCYWDPWWGYVCGTYVPTKTENDFSCNAGVGVRWDINKDFSLQGTYDLMWVDVSEASGGMPYSNLFKFEVIFRTNVSN